MNFSKFEIKSFLWMFNKFGNRSLYSSIAIFNKDSSSLFNEYFLDKLKMFGRKFGFDVAEIVLKLLLLLFMFL